MKLSGFIGTDRNPGRSLTSWLSSPLFVITQGACLRGPDAQFSGPGSFSTVGLITSLYNVPKSVPLSRTLISYIPSESKSCLGATKGTSYEQGHSLRRNDVHRLQAM